ncbi:MAG: FAD-binding oxidoreductase [Acidimicrobiales bacterium]
MTQLETSGVERLRAAVAGTVALDGEDGFADAINIWNGAIDRHPGVVVRATCPEDVVAALAYARESSMEVSVRGGGHGFAGFAITDGGVMIDLSLMKSISVDPESQRAVAAGGVTWAEFDAAAQVHGLTTPGGFISHTGVAGLTLGGGIGWLTRTAGLTCDNLLGAQVVLADGRIVHASDTENPDLMWALRGGGGNFGVVTSLEYRLHRVGPMVSLGMFFWSLDDGAKMLRFARDYVPTLPRDAQAFMAGLCAPPEPFVPDEYKGAPGYALIVVGYGGAKAHAGLIEPIRSLAPAWEMVTDLPWVALQQMFDAGAPWGVHAYEKAVHLAELTDAAIDVIVEHQPKMASELSFVPIFCLGGAYADVSDESTAFGGSRSSRYVLNVVAVCPDPSMLEAERDWVRAYWDALVPHAGSVGSYVNFMAEQDDRRVREAYGVSKYNRLAAIKKAYDPGNTFHLNANIRPA